MFNQVIKTIEAEKAELILQIEELRKIEARLNQLGANDAELEVHWHIGKLEVKYNALCDDIAALKKAVNQEKGCKRQQQKLKAEADGYNAYHSAITTGDYDSAVCPYKAKDLQKAWKKGFTQGINECGWIPFKLSA